MPHHRPTTVRSDLSHAVVIPPTPRPRRRRRDLRDARCLVTGASSGLGRAIALALGRAGSRVVLTGRCAERLGETARSLVAAGSPARDVSALVADLTSPADRTRLVDAVSERFDGALDLLVNAAGVGAYGRFESHCPAVFRELFEINVFAPAELTRGVLPLLRQGRRPAVVNIGSIVARRGLPGRSEYSASKFALAGFTESIRAEWSTDGIDVLLVNPGFTATAFEDHLLVNTAVYSTSSRRSTSADFVASSTLRALRLGRHELNLTPSGRLLLFLNRFFPRFLDFSFSLWTRRLYSNHYALLLAESPRATPPPRLPETSSSATIPLPGD